MINFIKYHFLHLFNKKWLFFLFLLIILSTIIFLYNAGGFYSAAERYLMMYEILEEYDRESFLIINIIVGFWIINSSKDIFILDEPHIYLIDKKKYIKTKIISYYLLYSLIIIFIYGAYQGIKVAYFHFRPFNYIILFNILLNALYLHLLILLIGGKNKNILFTVIMFVIYILLNGLYFINNWLIDIVHFFIPYLNEQYPLYGYIHIILIICLLYFIVKFKYYSDVE